MKRTNRTNQNAMKVHSIERGQGKRPGLVFGLVLAFVFIVFLNNSTKHHATPKTASLEPVRTKLVSYVTENDVQGKMVTYKGIKFYTNSTPLKENNLKLYLRKKNGDLFKNFTALEEELSKEKGEKLLFAMNAGMYTETNEPVGLYIEKGETKYPVDTRDSGYGNFYLQPNGVFVFSPTEAAILTRDQYKYAQEKYQYATQSGPLLVTKGVVNPLFKEKSTNKFVRNGVGITTDGTIVLAISDEPVNFHTFASFFKEAMQCENALYLDGGISSMYFPELGRYDEGNNVGPIIAITKQKDKPDTMD